MLPHASSKRENVQRCHIKAEFGKVKAMDYLLQRISVAILAIQCVHLNHCRLTIDCMFLLYLFLCLLISFNHLFIIDFVPQAYSYTNTARLETRAFLCSILVSEHLPQASIPYCRLTKCFCLCASWIICVVLTIH